MVNPRARLLVVDDDVTLVHMLELSLLDAGYEVISVSTGNEAINYVCASPPDLVILDIMIPGMSGWFVCQRIREVSEIPIIILSASDEHEVRLRGLQLGADDYISEPFDIQELVLRIAAILRRTLIRERRIGRRAVLSRYDDGALYIDLDRRIVQYMGREVQLTPHEYDLLACFVRHAGKTLSREYLLRQVWGLDPSIGCSDYVKTYIRYLRKKIEPDPAHPQYIITDRGQGYRLALCPKHRAHRSSYLPGDRPV